MRARSRNEILFRCPEEAHHSTVGRVPAEWILARSGWLCRLIEWACYRCREGGRKNRCRKENGQKERQEAAKESDRQYMLEYFQKAFAARETPRNFFIVGGRCAFFLTAVHLLCSLAFFK